MPTFLFLALLAVFSAAIYQRAGAQQPGKVHRIGYLTDRSETSERHWIAVFREGLRELGYAEGKNIVIELRRAAPGQRDRLRELVAELLTIA